MASATSRLDLGDIDGLSETMHVCAFGYPFGTYLASKEENTPVSASMSAASPRSANRRNIWMRSSWTLSFNRGNSGGPVLDTEGRVVGIVKSGIRGAGVNFAIPVNELKVC